MGHKESDMTGQLFSIYLHKVGGPAGPHHSKVWGLVTSQDLQLQGFKEIKVFYVMSLQDTCSTNRYDTPFFITIHFIAFLKLRKTCFTAGYLIFAWNGGVCVTEGVGRTFTFFMAPRSRFIIQLLMVENHCWIRDQIILNNLITILFRKFWLFSLDSELLEISSRQLRSVLC